MFYRRSLSCLVALAVALSLTHRGSAAISSPTEQGSSDQQLYQAYSEFFFLKRNMDFALEMSLRESFLAWLYQGINIEVAERSMEDPIGTLAIINPPELNGLDEASYAFPDSLLEAPLRIKYLAYEEYLLTEFNHKYLQARLIKDRLIRTATPTQLQRMFKHDLESVLFAYRDNLHREVVLQCDELIDRYGYKDVSDLAFYRAESYLALEIYDQAFEDYLFALNNSTEAWFRLKSLEKLISLAGDKGQTSKVLEFWERYELETNGNHDAAYWETADRAARYLMAGEEWKKAREILNAIPAGALASSSSLLRAGDCSLALLDLDDAEARYNAFLTPEKGKKVSDAEIREAHLKLGYVEYLRGRFDVAFQIFNSIEGSDETAERGQLSAIWCLYKLSAYQQVIERCNMFVREHPESQFFYEAQNLIGFSEEMLGQSDPALANYRVVMSALDDRQDFYDFNHELGAINSALGRLQELEALIFLGGERDLFPEYLEVRRQLNKLIDGVRFARALKTTPFLKEVLREQKELFTTFENQTELEDKIYEVQDAKLLNEYQKCVQILSDIGSELSAGIRYYMAQKSLIQREQDKLYENQVGDSVRIQLEREWIATTEAMTTVRQYLDNNTRNADPITLIDLAGVETELIGIQDRLLRVRSSLRKFGQETVTSNLDMWSDFAYQRYTYGGLNFDFLYSKEHRIQELDEYIRQVGTILQSREAARRDTLSIAAELIPAGNPGDAPYYAPAIPMWGMSIPVSPLADETEGGIEIQPDTNSVIEAPLDTLSVEPAPSMETPVPMENAPIGDALSDDAETTPASDDANKLEEPSSEKDASEINKEVEPTGTEGGLLSDEPSKDSPTPAVEPEPASEEPAVPVEELESAAPDSLGKDTTGTPQPDPSGSEEPQNGPSVP